VLTHITTFLDGGGFGELKFLKHLIQPENSTYMLSANHYIITATPDDSDIMPTTSTTFTS